MRIYYEIIYEKVAVFVLWCQTVLSVWPAD